MKIILELTEDDYRETKSEMVVTDTESPSFKWLEVGGRKYSVSTTDLEKLAMFV